MVALDEVIAQINDLFSGDHPDSSVRNVVTHIKDRLEESETLHQQAQNNSLPQFSASPDLQNEFVAAVIAAMDSSADLSAQILNNPELSQKLLGVLAPLIYQFEGDGLVHPEVSYQRLRRLPILGERQRERVAHCGMPPGVPR